MSWQVPSSTSSSSGSGSSVAESTTRKEGGESAGNRGHSHSASPTPSARPSSNIREPSFSKRHASFHSPSEVPLPSTLHHTFNRLPSPPPPLSVVCPRPVFSRCSSASTLTSSSLRPSSPRRSHQVAGRVILKDHELLAESARSGSNRSQGTHINPPSSLLHKSPLYIPQSDFQKEDPMHPKSSIDDLGGQAAVVDAMPHTDSSKFSSGRWSSDQLRPPLFYPSSPHSKSATNEQLPSSTQTNYHYEPDTQDSYRHGALYAPRPSRPSSSSSLPLPTQTPLSALPAFAETHYANHGHPHAHNIGGLPQVTENVQSNYEFTSSHGSTFESPRSSQNLPASTSSPASYHRLTTSSLAQHSSPYSASSAASTPSLHTSFSSRNSSASSSLPPPSPPTIYTPPLPDADSGVDGNNNERRGLGGHGPWDEKRTRAPYIPFLSHAPPPKDSYLAVETMEREYRLVVKLPGFKRECIMVSTRRKRMLHISADSWEADGGHFERRISFGYDADLAHVRAEFDGELLRIVVPRINPPVTWFSGGLD